MAKNEQSREANQPIWFDGKSINEALFCDDFLGRHKIIYTNGAFFTPDGRVTDELPLRGEIFEELKCCAVSNIPRKISNIVELMKLAALVEDFPPEADRIHLANGTLFLDGSFTEGKPDIVRCRLPVAYNPDAPTPTRWLAFLDGLLYPEDIPTLQEYIGYCLIPSNKGQRMMVIKGNGGEGKSQIGAVLSALFGSNMKDGSIGKFPRIVLPAPTWNTFCCVWTMICGWRHCGRPTMSNPSSPHRVKWIWSVKASRAIRDGCAPGCWHSAMATCRLSLTAVMAFIGGSWC